MIEEPDVAADHTTTTFKVRTRKISDPNMFIFRGDWKAMTSIKMMTPMEHSVSTVVGKITGLSFKEKELSAELEKNWKVRDGVWSIDSNFVHLKHPDYKPKKKPGRRKKKTRRRNVSQGDGTAFNSQISFTIQGRHVRNRPLVDDDLSKTAVPINSMQEEVAKPYIIKVFRNGKIQVPGCITEGAYDIAAPVEKTISLIRECDKKVYAPEGDAIIPIQLEWVSLDMINYKFRIIDYQVDLNAVKHYFDIIQKKLININFEDLCTYIIESDEFDPTRAIFELSDLKSIKNLIVNSVEFAKFTTQVAEKRKSLSKTYASFISRYACS